MKLWVDDIHPAPEGYRWLKKSVNKIKDFIEGIEEIFGNNYFLYNPSTGEKRRVDIELIDLSCEYTELLDWLKETGRNYPVCVHSTDVATNE